MTRQIAGVLSVLVALILAGCAGQPEQFSMQMPGEEPMQPITFPNGTTFGGASNQQASSLARIMVNSNNNNMKEFEELQQTATQNHQNTQETLRMLRKQGATGTKNLQTSQQALEMIEKLSQQQGTGEITLFFPAGSARLPSSGEQYDRLINFLDFLSRDSRGRKVLFVMIGSASATGNMSFNQRLSRERADAPEPIINQYLVNVPHEFHKVYGLGDTYSPKNVSLREDQRYQSVRIIAVYETNQIPRLQG
jgi:outer membrane protein OmpA-like peptidoglycan-associated protein